MADFSPRPRLWLECDGMDSILVETLVDGFGDPVKVHPASVF